MKYNAIQTRYSDVEEMQVRALTSDQDEKILEGYAVLYNVRSNLLQNSFYETIERGSFDDLLSKEGLDVVLNFNHSSDTIMGRTTNGTLKLSSDEKGLYFRAILPNTSYANDIYELVKRGDLHQNSFAFLPAEDGYTVNRSEDIDMVTINKVAKLRDVSVVTWPAYSETTVQARADEEIDEEIVSDLTDEPVEEIYNRKIKFLKLN